MFKLPDDDSEKDLKLNTNAADAKLHQRNHSSASEEDDTRKSEASSKESSGHKNPFALKFKDLN